MPRFAPCPLSPQGGECVPTMRMGPGISLFLCSPERRVYIPAPQPLPFSFTPCRAQDGLGEKKVGLWVTRLSQVPVRMCAITRGGTAALLG